MRFKNHLQSNLNLLLIIPIFLIKSKKFLLEPRIWAEEGTIYLKSALTHHFESVFKMQQGYFSIIPNITLYLASLGNYKYIPYYTSIISFCVWILLFIIINNINSKELKENYSFKFFLGTSIFIILNYFQEIFLNTINLQFITPIIVAVILLYDFNKLSKVQLYFIYFILTICFLNGVMYFMLIPFLFWKLYKSKKTYAFIFFVLVIMLAFGLIFLGKSNNETISLSHRISHNISLKMKILNGHNLKLLMMNNWYFILIFVSLITFYYKKTTIFFYSMATFFLFLFIDYSKLTISFVGRYQSITYCFLCLILFLIIQKRKYILGGTTFIVFLFFGKTFFHHEHSYSEKVNIWSDEYKKLYNKQPAKIHPEKWEINLQSK